MPKPALCPGVDELKRLLLGMVPDSEAASLEEHLSQCPACATKAEQLQAADTLVDAMRAQATRGDDPEQPAVDTLVERLRQLPAPLPGSATQATVALARAEDTPPSEPAAAVSDSTKELYTFLGPPQEPGELGRLGCYRVLRVLGEGGMGVVFEAQDTRLKRKVALKVMKPSLAANEGARQRFLREAEATAAVKSDHVVTIYQVDQDQGVAYLAMEFLEGLPLDRWQHGRRASVAQVLRLGREIAAGLAAAHARGLVHRDIKPGNIWLDATNGGRVKILDFGLARAAVDDIHLTQTGAIVGTPAYMAPEQARGETVDHRCDLFSLGCVLYGLCAGQPPFQGQTTMAVLTALATTDPKPLGEVRPDLPVPLSDLVQRLLAKKPEDRPASARAVMDALAAIKRPATSGAKAVKQASPRPPSPAASAVAPVGEASGNSRPTVLKPAAPRPVRKSPAAPASRCPTTNRRPIVIGLAAAALILVLAGVVLFWPTPNGTVRIEINDPEIKVIFDKDGPTITGADRQPITLRAGGHGLVVRRGDFAFETDKFVLKKGETAVLKIDFLDGKVRIAQDDKPIAEKEVPRITNSIGMQLALIQPGKFLMGSPDTEPGHSMGHNSREGPQHEVVITRPFYMGSYPVTVAQFRAFVKAKNYKTEAERNGGAHIWDNSAKIRAWKKHPRVSWEHPASAINANNVLESFAEEDNYPVTCVSWNDAQAFCAWLREKDGKKYALPTEAQWEYACRAGSQTRFFFGDDEKDLQRYAWPRARSGMVPVGDKLPNAWGLYDLYGPVWQWTADWYSDAYYRESPREDPSGPATGTTKTLRGGAIGGGLPWCCRSATREGFREPSFSMGYIGFRVVLQLSGAKEANQAPRPAPSVTPAQPAEALPPKLTNSIGMPLKLIQPGKFLMGSPDDEVGRAPDQSRGKEGPQHDVIITRPYYVGVCPVTVGQFKAFVTDAHYKTEAETSGGAYITDWSDPARPVWKRDPKFSWQHPAKFHQGDDHPVVCVSWNDAQAFCAWLTRKEGKSYRLPTEAQWEYACRAGSTTAYYFGASATELGSYAWFGQNSGRKTHPVGLKKPNAWGLYDMLGHVFQWTADRYSGDYYREGPREDPPGPATGETRTLRGGNFDAPSRTCRSATREGYRAPSFSSLSVGFRVVLLPGTGARPGRSATRTSSGPPRCLRSAPSLAGQATRLSVTARFFPSAARE